MRPAQWAKNLFVLAPLVFGDLLLDQRAAVRAGLAVLAFCCISSAVYLMNDLRDREEDRRHSLKRLRPLAAGTLSVSVAVATMIVLAAAAALIAFYLGVPFVLILGAYLALNVLYTLGFKHMVILDVMSISLGFVLRVEAGGVAVGVEVSRWLFLCTTFLALFLAFSKRRHEITLLAGAASGQRPVLDHYSPAFLDQMINVVTASAVVSYALYAVSPETEKKFGTQDLVYTIPLVLYGIFRYLYLVHQKEGGGSPSDMLQNDRPLLACVALWAVSVAAIVYAASGSAT